MFVFHYLLLFHICRLYQWSKTQCVAIKKITYSNAFNPFTVCAWVLSTNRDSHGWCASKPIQETPFWELMYMYTSVHERLNHSVGPIMGKHKEKILAEERQRLCEQGLIRMQLPSIILTNTCSFQEKWMISKLMWASPNIIKCIWLCLFA